MTFRRAVLYFLREASINLLRGWKISLLAVSTIGVSLFIGGCFLLVITNLSLVVEQWKQEVKVLVYLEPGSPPTEDSDLAIELAEPEWVTAVEWVTEEEARSRFTTSFPSLGDMVEGWEDEPLPGSFEVSFDPQRVDSDRFEAWVEGLRTRPTVGMVDDDRDWLRQLETALRVLAGIGLTLGLVLVTAAVFTIASVIRLTAFLYREEIEVMRLVGATEFFIRGPFYVEGFLQGLIGGLVALLALFGGWHFLTLDPHSFVLDVITADFVPFAQQLGLVGIGALSGLIGAVMSLRREVL